MDCDFVRFSVATALHCVMKLARKNHNVLFYIFITSICFLFKFNIVVHVNGMFFMSYHFIICKTVSN